MLITIILAVPRALQASFDSLDRCWIDAEVFHTGVECALKMPSANRFALAGAESGRRVAILTVCGRKRGEWTSARWRTLPKVLAQLALSFRSAALARESDEAPQQHEPYAIYTQAAAAGVVRAPSSPSPCRESDGRVLTRHVRTPTRLTLRG